MVSMAPVPGRAVYWLSREQSTVPVTLQNRPLVTPLGRVSLTATLRALDGPALCTVRVYSTVFPAKAVAGPFLVMVRSAEAVTSSVSVAWLLAAVTSGSLTGVESILAVLARAPFPVAWLGATARVSW